MSHSLNVVKEAAVFWDSFSLSAILKRMRFIFTRCSEREKAAVGVDGAGSDFGAGVDSFLG